MLARQIQEWQHYPSELRIILVDDGSPIPALPVVAQASDALKSRLRLYRILIDKPWHRSGARNLAAAKCDTDWLCSIDIDHVLPAASAVRLVEYEPNENFWYRFRRFRVGKADATRRKDKIADDVEFAEIHPHIDSHLMPIEMFRKLGGYDEMFSGCLGGGTDFLRRMEWHFGAPLMLPSDIALHVFTMHAIPDASVTSLSRDTRPGKEIARRKSANRAKPVPSLAFPWERQL